MHVSVYSTAARLLNRQYFLPVMPVSNSLMSVESFFICAADRPSQPMENPIRSGGYGRNASLVYQERMVGEICPFHELRI